MLVTWIHDSRFQMCKPVAGYSLAHNKVWDFFVSFSDFSYESYHLMALTFQLRFVTLFNSIWALLFRDCPTVRISKVLVLSVPPECCHPPGLLYEISRAGSGPWKGTFDPLLARKSTFSLLVPLPAELCCSLPVSLGTVSSPYSLICRHYRYFTTVHFFYPIHIL